MTHHYSLAGIKKDMQKTGVSAVYLFGSRARSQEGPLSDYDFGILLNEKISPKKYFDAKLSLMALFSKKFRTDHLDIVILNDCNTLLAMNIIKEGKILYEKDRQYRIAFENHTMLTYYDRLPYEERYTKTLLQRLA